MEHLMYKVSEYNAGSLDDMLMVPSFIPWNGLELHGILKMQATNLSSIAGSGAWQEASCRYGTLFVMDDGMISKFGLVM